MAIESAVPPQPTANLADDKNTVFYPLHIPISHWQLRHFISVPASTSARDPEENVLYYASGHDVYCLNTKSRKRKHVVELPFAARCTASGYGYVCVGGDDAGCFVTLKLEGGATSFAGVDERIAGIANISGERRRDERRTSPEVRVQHIGDDIVNSVSLHRLTCEDAHLEDTVAVLTNNDKTVRVYSLTSGLETCVKDLPFPMNHATISPCGTMMVAVGDEPQAFFFKRELLKDPPQIPKPHNRLNSSSVGWRLTDTVNLHVSKEASPYGQGGQPKGYFTTAWSSNSKLCAVGSEGGYITVFDTDRLCGREADVSPIYDERFASGPVVAMIPGTRPDVPSPHPGAIRSMLFSPPPWDLLFWTEDQGRICIGDLRTGLRTRQVVELQAKEGEAKHAYYVDVADDGDVVAPPTTQQPRTRELEDDDDIWSHRRDLRALEEYYGGDNYRLPASVGLQSARLQQHARRSREQQMQQGLTEREAELLNSIRTTQQRNTTNELHSTNASSRFAPFYPTYENMESMSDDENGRPRRTQITLDLIRSAAPDLSARSSSPSYFTDPDQDPTEEDEEAWRPIERMHASTTQQRSSLLRAADAMIAHDSVPLAVAVRTWGAGTSSSRRNRTAENQLTRQPSTIYPGPSPADVIWRRHNVARNRNGVEVGPRTTGLALSHDGRTLFAACEDGILEVQVNLKGRMYINAVDIR